MKNITLYPIVRTTCGVILKIKLGNWVKWFFFMYIYVHPNAESQKELHMHYSIHLYSIGNFLIVQQQTVFNLNFSLIKFTQYSTQYDLKVLSMMFQAFKFYFRSTKLKSYLNSKWEEAPSLFKAELSPCSNRY